MATDIRFRAMRDDKTPEGAVCKDILQAYEDFKACDAENKRLIMIISQGADIRNYGLLSGANPNEWYGQVRMTKYESLNTALKGLQEQIKADNAARYAAAEEQKKAAKAEAMRLKHFKAAEHPNVVEAVRKNTSIIDVVSKYSAIEQNNNGEYVAKSPLYKNGGYTLLIDAENQKYTDFAYGISGDTIDFMTRAENAKRMTPITEEDTIKTLIKEKPDLYSDELKDIVFSVEKKVDEINQITKEFYHNGIGADEGKCLNYFKDRGFTNKTIEVFGLGYAKGESWNCLRSYMHKKNFGDEQLECAGVAAFSQKTGRYFDTYHDRAIIPIHDKDGKCVGFGGRTLVDDKAKYINTKETVCFHKSDILFNFNVAKNTRQPSIIVVEGFMDCISAYQSGFDNVVAGMGTALTEQQAELLKSTGKEVILAYDNDESGQKASKTSTEILAEKGIKVSTLDMTKTDASVFGVAENGIRVKDFNDILCTYGRGGLSNLFTSQNLNVSAFNYILAANSVPSNLIENTLNEQNVLFMKKDTQKGVIYAIDKRKAEGVKESINTQLNNDASNNNGQKLI